MTIWIAHARPQDNNCFDDFAAAAQPLAAAQGIELRYERWDGAWEPRAGDTLVCALQDPIGPSKVRALLARVAPGVRVLNHPDAANRARRDVAYPRWALAGLRCPDPPRSFDFVSMPRPPFLVKDVTRQMGRGFLVKDLRYLDWLITKSRRFKPARFSVLPYVDLRDAGGYHRLHRYIVCGDVARPVVFAKTRSWNCKASHMVKDVKRWSSLEISIYKEELQDFWESTPHPDIVWAVRSLGLDYGLVDCVVMDDGVPFLWEVNPYCNLRPAEATGKPEVWWPMFAGLLGISMPYGRLDADAYVDNILNWQGYQPHWRKRDGRI